MTENKNYTRCDAVQMVTEITAGLSPEFLSSLVRCAENLKSLQEKKEQASILVKKNKIIEMGEAVMDVLDALEDVETIVNALSKFFSQDEKEKDNIIGTFEESKRMYHIAVNNVKKINCEMEKMTDVLIPIIHTAKMKEWREEENNE